MARKCMQSWALAKTVLRFNSTYDCGALCSAGHSLAIRRTCRAQWRLQGSDGVRTWATAGITISGSVVDESTVTARSRGSPRSRH